MSKVKSDTEAYYVTMTWDDWPEGGSYGTVVMAHSHAEAEELCKREMAVFRACEDLSPAEARASWGDEWHTVDCMLVRDLPQCS